MRHKLEVILGDELRSLAINTRERLCLTQREMGERLHMSESSCSDIETGKNRSGALTSILILQMQDDPNEFLKRLEVKFAELYSSGVQTL